MSNSKVIIDFIEAWNQMDFDSISSALDENIFYHNIPMEPIQGKEATLGFLMSLTDCESIFWELLFIAENEGVVLTERVDNFNYKDGRKISLPVMGTFEIKDNKIIKWRDYFDLSTFQKQIMGES